MLQFFLQQDFRTSEKTCRWCVRRHQVNEAWALGLPSTLVHSWRTLVCVCVCVSVGVCLFHRCISLLLTEKRALLRGQEAGREAEKGAGISCFKCKCSGPFLTKTFSSSTACKNTAPHGFIQKIHPLNLGLRNHMGPQNHSTKSG